MILEAGNHLIESIPAVTAVVSLLIGAVRVIPTAGLCLEIFDTAGKGAGKTPRITDSGHAIVPDRKSATIGLFSNNHGLQTYINVHDATTRNLKTSQATITGALGNHLVTLTHKNERAFLFGKNLFVRYTSTR